MERREFLAKSCVASLASVAVGAAASGQRRPNETDAAYRTRMARARTFATSSKSLMK